jgi:FKBP-type peptidyl-prolyl cis-trans isomerase (trigger factor)
VGKSLENRSQSVTGNSTDNSSVTLDQNERINLIKDTIRNQAKASVYKAIPLRIITAILKDKIDENTIKKELKKLAEIAEVQVIDEDKYELTE